jgi:N-acylneuraminate cytidylyltransferase
VQNASLEIAWVRVVLKERTIAGNTLMPFLTEGYEGFDLNNSYDWDLAERWVLCGDVVLPAIPQDPYPLKQHD